MTATQIEATTDPAALANQTLRALIVDDDPRWRAITAEILSELGGGSTASAAPAIDLSGYRLAVLDIGLNPDDAANRDGLLLTQQLARLGTPCIILSGLVDAELSVDLAHWPNVLDLLPKDTFRRETFINLLHQSHVLPVTASPSVLIVEDEARWRAIYEDILADAGYTLHSATSYAEARGWLQRMDFALAIVDLHLISSSAPQENRDGFWLLRAARQRGLPTIVVSALGAPEDIDRAYEEFDVYAFVGKEGFERHAFLRTVAEAIRTRPLDARPTPADSSTSTGPDRSPADDLTDREREVLALLVEGCTNRQISDRLGITPNTVKKHVDHILQKLAVSNRAGAVAVALRDGLRTH